MASSYIPFVNYVLKFLNFFIRLFKTNLDPNCDSNRDIFQLASSRGFQLEEHEVITKDGYILKLHRLVNPLNEDKSGSKPVLCLHGFGCTSTHFLIASNDGQAISPIDTHLPGYKMSSNMGFALSNAGHDVWLANTRGNVHSLKHVTLSVSDVEFWNFSLDELIAHDLPSLIDYVLKITNHSRLSLVGFSQGTSQVFGLLSSRPEYNSRIDHFFALGPVTRLTNAKPPLRYFMKDSRLCVARDKLMGGRGRGAPALAAALTKGHIFAPLVLKLVHFFHCCLVGFNHEQRK